MITPSVRVENKKKRRLGGIYLERISKMMSVDGEGGREYGLATMTQRSPNLANPCADGKPLVANAEVRGLRSKIVKVIYIFMVHIGSSLQPFTRALRVWAPC